VRSMFKRNIAACMLICTVLFLAITPIVSAAIPVTDARMTLSGSPTLGTLRSGTYSATFDDPLEREWSYQVYITASNTTGASPLKNSPLNGTLTPENNSFTFDITAQQSIGYLEIHINCTSGVYYYEKVQRINVVYPVSLKAQIRNPTAMEISNATVQFFVDGNEIDKQIIQTIGANQTVNVESEWISTDKEPGWHDSRIVLDLNSDGIIDTHSGDMIIDNSFYIEGESNWLTILIIFIGLMALIAGFGYISKRKM